MSFDKIENASGSPIATSIEKMTLLREEDFRSLDGPHGPMDVVDFYDSLETKRMGRLDIMVQRYHSIESLLIKVGSFSPTSPCSSLSSSEAQNQANVLVTVSTVLLACSARRSRT